MGLLSYSAWDESDALPCLCKARASKMLICLSLLLINYIDFILVKLSNANPTAQTNEKSEDEAAHHEKNKKIHIRRVGRRPSAVKTGATRSGQD